jgi:uncharacterized protein YjbI with pentapeptide repeats
LDFNHVADNFQGVIDLSGAQFRGYDLRKFNLRHANLTNCYLRNADLRGLDLSEALMEGASLKDAKISGTLFPRNIAATEIRLSFDYGTRLRSRD